MKKSKHYNKNASNWKGGITLIKYYCLDCGKQLGKLVHYKKTKRCHSCAMKERLKDPKNHPCYQDGRYLKQYYCKDCGIEISRPDGIRCRDCNLKQTGKNSPHWLGGISFAPYSIEFNNELKKEIRDRDNHECQNCYIKEIELYRLLDVHHIDYDKMNCKSNNLIALCSKCNIIANYNRDYWFAYFTYKIKEHIYEKAEG